MSTTDKERVGTLFTWVFRVLTGMGALFLMGIYNQIQDANAMLVRMQVEGAGVSYTLRSHEQSITRLERCCELQHKAWQTPHE